MNNNRRSFPFTSFRVRTTSFGPALAAKDAARMDTLLFY